MKTLNTKENPNAKDTTHFEKNVHDWFQVQVLNWAKHYGRHYFPWQTPHTPYKTWISEIMLQQTQAHRVIHFFTTFVAAFPNVHVLANAQEDEVFHLWSGLGYYTRAKNILTSAKIITREHAGEVPSDIVTLMSLPGIGRSTAGAIRSLGHGLDGEILDGNVRRVLGRFNTIQGKPQSKSMETQYWNLVSKLTPKKPLLDRAFNQAMMDLGATICTIKQPKCLKCPLQNTCKAHQMSVETKYPITPAKYKNQQACPKAIKQSKRKKIRFYLFAQHQNSILLEKRPSYGIWSNLWCPIEFKTLDELTQFTMNQFGLNTHLNALEPIDHQFTHFHLELHAYTAQVKHTTQEPKIRESERYLWYNTNSPPHLGLASPITKLIHQITKHTAKV